MYKLTLKEQFEKPKPDIVLYYKSKSRAISRGEKWIYRNEPFRHYKVTPIRTED